MDNQEDIIHKTENPSSLNIGLQTSSIKPFNNQPKTKWRLITVIIILILFLGSTLSAYLILSQEKSVVPAVVPTQVTPSPETTLAPGYAMIAGQLIIKSDVQTIPDIPAIEGSIALIPSEKFNLFVKEEEISSSFDDRQLGHLQKALSEEVALKYIASTIPFDEKGTFADVISQGNYILCHNYNSSKQSQFPVKILGCIRIEAKEGEKVNLNLESVFGGLVIANQKTEQLKIISPSPEVPRNIEKGIEIVGTVLENHKGVGLLANDGIDGSFLKVATADLKVDVYYDNPGGRQPELNDPCVYKKFINPLFLKPGDIVGVYGKGGFVKAYGKKVLDSIDLCASSEANKYFIELLIAEVENPH